MLTALSFHHTLSKAVLAWANLPYLNSYDTSSYLTILIILSNIFALSSLLISSTIDTNNFLAKLILCSVCSIFISNLSRPSSNFFLLLFVIGSSFANTLYKCEYDTSTFFATSLRLIALLSIFSLYKLMISSLVIYATSRLHY